MGLTAIKNNSNWGASAADLNNNFASITAELEKLKAANIKFKGYFTSEDSLKAAYPSPGIGDNAWVGDTYPGVVYQCESYGVWTNTGLIPSAPSVELVDYAKKEMLTEYNVSVQHPSSGIGGSNQYTFATAVALVPSTLRNVGLKCLFLNSGGKIETWEYQGGTFTAAGSWLQIGSGKFAELKKDIADVSAGAVMQATDEILGGIKASPKTDNESAEVKIDPQTGKLYAPQGGGGAQITVDDALSGTSTNPVQNKIVKAEFDKKALKSDVQSLAGSISENTQDISELQSTVGTLRTETSSAKTSAQQAQRDAAAAKGAVAALEGLSNTSTAQKELAAQLTQIAENTLGVLQIRQNKYSESLYLHKEITPLKVIEGAIINTSGTLTVSTNYKGIFDVAVYSLAGVANLLLSGQMEGTLMEYVISSTSESITSVKNGPVYNGSTGLISFFSQIPVPNNGKYIFVSQHNSYRRTRLFDLGREVGSLVGTDYASARSSRMKPFETHAGYFISNSKSGTNYSIVASAAYNIKVYDVTNVKRVHIRGEASKSCSVYCFASSKAFNISSSVGNIIGNSRQVNSGNDYIDEVVEVPSNAKVLYVTEHLGTPADPILTKYAINVYSEEEQEKLITSLPVVTIFNHYILSTAAGLVANGGPYRVVLYDVTGRDKIRLYGEGNGGIAHYVFTAIDSLSNPIQIGRTASSADGIIRFDEEVVVPSGAKRLWIT